MSDMNGFLGKVFNDSLADSKEHKNNMDGYRLIGQRKVNIVQQEKISEQTAYIRELERTIQELKSKNSSLKETVDSNIARPREMAKNLEDAIRIGKDAYKTSTQIREEESQKYESLLAQPMHIIAQQNEKFKETYEEQQTLLADWMVSQKAFKELAIQFGVEKGLQPNEIIEMGLDKKIDVLEDKHEPSHNTIAGDSTIIGPRREVLLEKAQKDKAARKAKKVS